MFSDLKTSSNPGVDLLLQPIRVTVEEVCHDEQKLVLSTECEFHPERPILCDGNPLAVIHHEADAIWVEDSSSVHKGSQVCQTRLVGTHADLSNEFVAAWRERWMRHADVPPERWTTIIEFAKTHMAPNSFQWMPMQPEDLHQVICP